MRLYEGGMAIIVKLLVRMHGQIDELGSQMATILEQVQALQQPSTTGVVHRPKA